MGTPVAFGKQMSEGLRARLKRCGRSYSSPASAKRQCTAVARDFENSDTPQRGKIITSKEKLCDPLNSNSTETSPKPVVSPLATCNHGNQSDDEKDGENPCRRLEEEFSQSADDRSDASVACVPETPPSGLSCKSDNSKSMKAAQTEKCRLIKEIKEKEEKLRKLKMVKMYRSKNNLEELSRLTEKWRTLCQELLLRLHSLTLEPRPTLRDMVTHLQIDPSMVRFSPDDESFS